MQNAYVSRRSLSEPDHHDVFSVMDKEVEVAPDIYYAGKQVFVKETIM